MRSNTITTTLKLCALVALTLAAMAITLTGMRGSEPETVYAAKGPQMDMRIGTCTTDAGEPGDKANGIPTCEAAVGDQFELVIDLNELFGMSYTGFQTSLTFSSPGVTYYSTAVDPQCTSSQVTSEAGALTVTCNSVANSTYIGDLVTVTLSCTEGNHVIYLPTTGTPLPTYLLDKSSQPVQVDFVVTTLRISLTCVAPPPDGDSDGCPDAAELGTDPAVGGQRDPANFWDFLDVWTGIPAQRDGTVSVSDVQATVQRFGAIQDPPPAKQDALAEALTSPPPAPAYHASFDRGPGSSGTTVTPPDGVISVGDIGVVVSQFGHSCL